VQGRARMLDSQFSQGSRYDLAALNVLVVEDNANMQKLLGVMLRSLGITRIEHAESGKEALAILGTFEADIVITDWEMKPMNGLELTRELRTGKSSPNPYVSIIMVTGKTEMEHVIQARDAGINHLLTKPVSVKSLADRITALIDHPAPFVRTDTYFGPNRRHRSVDLPEGFADRRKAEPEAASESGAESGEEAELKSS